MRTLPGAPPPLSGPSTSADLAEGTLAVAAAETPAERALPHVLPMAGGSASERDLRLEREVQRLRAHLLEREDVLTQEILELENQLVLLREQLAERDAALAAAEPAQAAGTATEEAAAVANLQGVIELLQAGTGTGPPASGECGRRKETETNVMGATS